MAFFFKRKKQPTIELDSFEIPSFSTSVMTLLSKLRDPDINVGDLSSDLESDPGLYLRVLKMVNSASFGLSRKVSSIQHAVNLLGRSRLEALVLSVAVKNNLSSHSDKIGINMTEFWKTASLRAAVAKALALELHPNQQSDVFTIGLLQDMAIPMLAQRHKEAYQTLFERWQSEANINLAEEENAQFGIDHMTLGAHMAEAWEFPAELIAAIGDHHDFDSSAIPLSVKIAALITGTPQHCCSQSLTDRASEAFNLDRQEISPFIELAFEQSAELSAALE